MSSTSPAVDDGSGAVESFLGLESTKLALSKLEAHASASRTAVTVLLSACAYVAVTAVGYAGNERAREKALATATLALDEKRQALTRVERADREAFEAYLEAAVAAEEADVSLAVETKDVGISEKRLQLERAAQTKASIQRDEKDRASIARIKVAQEALEASRVEVAGATKAIEAFKEKDAEARLEWDRNRGEIPLELASALQRAQRKVQDLETRLEQVRREARLSPPVPPSSVASSSSEGLLDGDLRLRSGLKNLAGAKSARIRAHNDWQRAERDLAAAETAYVRAMDGQSRLDREPPELSLPVLNATVSAQIFFAAAPLLLLAFYGNVAILTRACLNAKQALAKCPGAQHLGSEALARAIPVLDHTTPLLTKLPSLGPHLVAYASLLALVVFNPERAVSVVALSLALVTGLALVWASREAHRKSTVPARRGRGKRS
jgi:hypothetical protein